MHKDKAIGLGLLIAGILGIIIYGWLVFSPLWQLVLRITAFIAVAAILGIIAWVGYALATTPPPKPIEEIEREVQKTLEEIEKEIGEQKDEQKT